MHKICFTIVETAIIFLVRILVRLILLENLQVRWLAFSGGHSVVVLINLFADFALILWHVWGIGFYTLNCIFNHVNMQIDLVTHCRGQDFLPVQIRSTLYHKLCVFKTFMGLQVLDKTQDIWDSALKVELLSNRLHWAAIPKNYRFPVGCNMEIKLSWLLWASQPKPFCDLSSKFIMLCQLFFENICLSLKFTSRVDHNLNVAFQFLILLKLWNHFLNFFSLFIRSEAKSSIPSYLGCKIYHQFNVW